MADWMLPLGLMPAVGFITMWAHYQLSVARAEEHAMADVARLRLLREQREGLLDAGMNPRIVDQIMQGAP